MVLLAPYSRLIFLDKGAKLTQAIAVESYGGFFMALTVFALLLTVVAFVSSRVIKKMLNAADEWDKQHPQADTDPTA